MHLGETLMLYIQYQLHNSWGDPYKWAARGENTQILAKIDTKYWYYYHYAKIISVWVIRV